MKPKTKIQKECAAASSTLLPVKDEVIKWGIDNCFDKLAFRTKKVIHCLECGHSWGTKEGTLIGQLLGCTCPACGAELKVKNTRQKAIGDSVYLGVITTHKGWQLIRIFWFKQYCMIGTKVEYIHREVMQHWINKNGKRVQWSLNIQAMNYQLDSWVFNSELEIRNVNPRYIGAETRFDIEPYKYYPKTKILPEIMRNGFAGNYHNIAPQKFFMRVLSDSRFETLLKVKQYSLLKCPGAYYMDDKLDLYWPTVKICIRNNYVVKDVSIYFDYLNLLEYFGKDLRSPKYVCPENLKKEHDRLVDKKQRILEKIKLEEMRKKIAKEQELYKERMKQFFGICFTDGQISVKVLEHVSEFYEEGKKHKHCVFSNEYYKKSDSLIMSARINEEPIETVELSLKEMKVLQSRGLQNKLTEYHDRILQLIDKNIPTIQKVQRERSRKSLKTA